MHPGIWLRPGAARWLLPALGGWVGGVALQLTQKTLWPSWWYALALVLGLMAGIGLLLRQARSRLPAVTMVLVVATLSFGQVGLRAVVFQARGLPTVLEGRDLQVTGVVTTMPQFGAAGMRLHMRIESARAGGVPVALPPLVLLGWYSSNGGTADDAPQPAGSVPAVWAGERWLMTVRLKAPHGNRNPHGFDYELWLWEHGLQATGYVRTGGGNDAPLRLGQTGRYPVEWLRQAVRQRIDARLVESAQAGWITALVTGDQHAIERADWDVFRATGVAHLMSISGLHITLFAWLATRLANAAWRRSSRLCLRLPAPQAALLGGLLLASAYALFSGWGVPSQRTVWMLAVVCGLRMAGRSWPWPMVWLLAGVVVLVMDPWALHQAGFWLSFVAVGVLFASDSPAAGVARLRPWSHLRAMLREQWVMTLALTPLVLLLFGQVSLVGFIANLFAIPWVTLLLTPLALLGVLAPPAWDLAAVAVAVLAAYLGWLAQLPHATLVVPAAPAWIGVAGVLGGLLLVLGLPARFRIVGAALVVPVLLWQSPRPLAGQFELLAADVGQGTAVLVRTSHHALLYDTGPRYSRDSDAGHRVLVPLLRALGVELDLLVLSHRDSDHVGGAQSVLAMQARARLIGSIEPEHGLWALRQGHRCEHGQSWQWDGVVFTILHPRPEDYGEGVKPNALSCVLRVSASGGASAHAAAALLTGDIEAAQEGQLVQGAATLQADLLLVPHHGSKTSSSAAFLDAVSPRVALVQNGYRNRFGHPAAAPMARYAERGIRVVDSPHCGAMRWSSVEPGVVACQREAERRYWQHPGR